MKKQPKLLRSYKIPDPPVSLNARVAAADRGSGQPHAQHDMSATADNNRGKDSSPTLARTLARIGVGKQLGYMTVDQGTSDQVTSEDQTTGDRVGARGGPAAMGSRPGDEDETLEPSTYVCAPALSRARGALKPTEALRPCIVSTTRHAQLRV